MSDKPKCRRWQIHLGTAIVLLFEASALLWLNVRHTQKSGIAKFPVFVEPIEVATLNEYQGWPMYYQQLLFTGTWDDRMNPKDQIGGAEWRIPSLVLDAFVCLVILVMTSVVSEWLIRRREHPKA